MREFGRVALGVALSIANMVCLGIYGQVPKPVTPVPVPATHSDQKQNPVQTPKVTASGAGAGSQATTAHPLEKADLEAFFDGILPLQLERGDVAGASVLVMQDDQVLLKKGYGFADVKSGRLVDPDTTIFRLASISKLFTWVSIMQLEEQGKLNLDADINNYLDFRIRPAYGKPITLRNLMTHTGGFEESANDIIFTDPKKVISLRDYLIANQPMRLFPPGEVPAYSNYGVGLGSYIVQRVSGEPFEKYVQEHIFGPLGMAHSSFYQPLPKPLEKLPSEGYRDDTTKPPVGFEIFNPVGAGGVSSSAADMGRFGQALLHGGELDGKRILKPETLARMWTPQFQANPKLPPICMGFYQAWRNNLRWIGHEGDLIAFHSLFFMEPTHHLLIFVSYNSAAGGDKPRPEIIDFFTDRYFPRKAQPEFLKKLPAGMRDIEGTYESSRRADSTRMALGNLFGQAAARVDKDGLLTIGDRKNLRGHEVKWKAIGKDLWFDEDGQSPIFAVRDGSGSVVRIAVEFPGVQLTRVPWYENSRLVLPTAGISLGILVLVVLASLLRLGRRIFLRKRPRPAPQPGTVWLGWGSRLAAFVWILLLGSVGGVLAEMGDDAMPPNPDWFPWLIALNWATGLALLLSLFAAIAGIRIWTRDVRWITRVKFTLVGLACLVVSVVAIHWHLIGPSHRL